MPGSSDFTIRGEGFLSPRRDPVDAPDLPRLEPFEVTSVAVINLQSLAKLPICRLLITNLVRAALDYCRGRDDHHWSPPAQIRTSAFTHTALTVDG